MLFLIILITILTIIGLIKFSPKTKLTLTLYPITLPNDIEQYLAAHEAQYSNIQPNAEKKIIWADPETKAKTPLAIIYLHGFSANRQEIAPLPELVAQAMGANLFYTRLTGHGQDGEALGRATANEWLNDTLEAWEIGCRLGEKVIIMGTSTGATLATWLATHHQMAVLEALVLFSPNYRPYDPKSELLLQPWSPLLVRLLIGHTTEWEPINPEHGLNWTNNYPPMYVLPEMMQLVDYVRAIDLSQINHPVCILYCPRDKVVSPAAIINTYKRFGSTKKLLIPIADTTNDPQKHVVVGDIMAPHDTLRLTKGVVAFLTSVRDKMT